MTEDGTISRSIGTLPDGRTVRMRGDHVLIRMLPLDETTGSGIVLVRGRDSTNQAERRAVVLAAGPGVQKRRHFVPTYVDKGDIVLTVHLVGSEVPSDHIESAKNFGESQAIDSLRLSAYRICKESDLRAIVGRVESEAAE
jgi:co-chaperonin GroES (HSP10)